MNRLREKFARFMYGRYGVDELGKALMYLSLGMIVISMFWGGKLLNALIWMTLIFSYYRMFSKNHAKRWAENQKYLQLKRAVMTKFRARKGTVDRQHRIFQCPTCGQKLRVPRGKGKISIHCPKCQNDFIKRT